MQKRRAIFIDVFKSLMELIMKAILIRFRPNLREFWVEPELLNLITHPSMQVTQSLIGYMHESSGSAWVNDFNLFSHLWSLYCLAVQVGLQTSKR